METATQALHRLTRNERDRPKPAEDPRVLQDFEPLDLARFPRFFKWYPQSLQRVPLPRDLPRTTASAVAVLAGTANAARTDLDLAHLSRVLHLSAGVVRTTQWRLGTWLFRAAGSAGGRFPLELYIAIPNGSTLPGGVHWYHPQEHALVQIAPPPRDGLPTVVVTGVPWRTGWKYMERGYRHVYWDAGTMLSQLIATADSAGLAPSLYTHFPDAGVAALVGADGAHEWPVAVVAFGDGAPALESTGPAATGHVDTDPTEFPLLTAAQRAGDRDALGPQWDRGAPVDVTVNAREPVEAVVLTRSSQRRMDPTRGVAENVLRTSMAVAMRGIRVSHWVVVHDVEGIAPGVYRWPDLSAPLRAGSMRDEIYHAAWEQALPRDAAFVVIGTTNVGELDDRQYRESQLAAGLVEGRLHLLAYALDASASGMTFLDAEVPALLGEEVDTLLFTCVGVPEYRPRPGGSPGTPTPFRQVKPRVEDE